MNDINIDWGFRGMDSDKASTVKKARLEAGLDQNDVARLLKRTQSYVSKLESGQRRIDITQLKELSRIYKKDIEFFLK